ncbi:mechanosensitive ion channel family protein [Haladaptatus halobius]|uniref:mechanosensitive ion channel family protein n=1 Tax=Haladaptatus halobius TaxID=2884875 RepID=UPI001D0AAD20|nr:mechanosensitive ion channel family protein [Haladaptatus halobius]
MISTPLQTSAQLLPKIEPLIRNSLKFVFTFLVVYALGRALVLPLLKRLLTQRGFDETVANLTQKIIGVIWLFAATAVAFTIAGFGNFLTAFATLSGAIALAVGLASQNLLSNFVAGIFILKDRPFEIGDWVEWSDKAGTVEDIDLRVTRVRTFNNKRITVPNSELADSAVTNVVAHDNLREAVTFGIGYDDDIAEATTSILEVADQHEQILDEPTPEVRVTELADSYVGLEARIWVEDPTHADFSAVRSEFVTAVKERFDAMGITIPYPQRQLSGGFTIMDDAQLVKSANPSDD